MFQASRQHASEEELAKRIIRVVKMDSLSRLSAVSGVIELDSPFIVPLFLVRALNLGDSLEYYTSLRRTVKAGEKFPKLIIK